jgi:hypothetical protein
MTIFPLTLQKIVWIDAHWGQMYADEHRCPCPYWDPAFPHELYLSAVPLRTTSLATPSVLRLAKRNPFRRYYHQSFLSPFSTRNTVLGPGVCVLQSNLRQILREQYYLPSHHNPARNPSSASRPPWPLSPRYRGFEVCKQSYITILLFLILARFL